MIHNFFNKVIVENNNVKNTNKKVIRSKNSNYHQKKKFINEISKKIQTNEMDNLILVNFHFSRLFFIFVQEKF